MRWREKALDEMQARIVQMGLSSCPICNSGQLQVMRVPTMESIGDVYRPRDDPEREPDANVLFLVHVECDGCGYVLFFNSERLRGSNKPSLVRGGLTPEEEAEAERRLNDD